MERLLQLLYEAKSANSSDKSVYLTWRVFEAILEVSSHSELIWKAFNAHLMSSTLLRDLILLDSRVMIRKNVVKLITFKYALGVKLDGSHANQLSRPGHPRVPLANRSITFWSLVSDLVNDAVQYESQGEDVLWLCKNLFTQIIEMDTGILDPWNLLNQWGDLLLSKHNQEVCSHLNTAR